METVLGGIIVAALSGLTYLAYKHPKGYAKLNLIITTAFFVIFISYHTWRMGVTEGYYSVVDYIQEDKETEARFKYQKKLDIFPDWVEYTFLGIWIYIFSLNILPSLTNDSESKRQE